MRTIAVLLYDGMRAFDFGVITEVWGVDRSGAGVPRFDLLRCSERRRTVTAEAGVGVRPTHGLAGLAAADLVVIPGSTVPDPPVSERLFAALRRARSAGVPVAALCAGAFLLGRAGLLEDRRATTHWMLVDRLKHEFPLVRVEPDALFVADGGVYTSAGTAAGIDLCLHLVREAHGTEVAAAVARRMVTPPHREGGQRQPHSRRPAGGDDVLYATVAWARERLAGRLTVRELAAQAHMSERTFARRFAELTGTTVLRWIHQQRLQRAQLLLESTDLTVEVIAQRSGFGSALALRRQFGKAIGTTPSAYRAAFQALGSRAPQHAGRSGPGPGATS
ncbi:helix-turn-helix domain-containing protein [Streptomyces pathocidini]|uniref:GlxA family transcriptional regulator n=1 Tax=Streptomyces pathocidini TaxID=1650571 RepID=UPI0033C91FE2